MSLKTLSSPRQGRREHWEELWYTLPFPPDAPELQFLLSPKLLRKITCYLILCFRLTGDNLDGKQI
jgi:hypothetical protein